MNIGSICTRHAVTVDASSTLLEAARLMREHHVGALLVVTDVGDGEQVVGIDTDRDLVVEAMHRGIAHESARRGPLDPVQPTRAIRVPVGPAPSRLES